MQKKDKKMREKVKNRREKWDRWGLVKWGTITENGLKWGNTACANPSNTYTKQRANRNLCTFFFFFGKFWENVRICMFFARHTNLGVPRIDFAERSREDAGSVKYQFG